MRRELGNEPRSFYYVRVSCDESAVSGLSPAAQRKAILDYASLAGTPPPVNIQRPADEPTGFFCDYAQSAYKVPMCRRPYGQMLYHMLQPGDHIVIYSVDRGFRSVRDFATTTEQWLKNNINVHFVRERVNMGAANGKLLANILAAIAQWQSDIKSERLKEVNHTKKSKGKADIRLYKRDKTRWTSELKVWNQTPPSAATPIPGVVYSYGRVSHASSLAGSSLEHQRDRLNKYAEYMIQQNPLLSRGDHFEDEAVSAFSKKFIQRPAGSVLNERLRRGDHVIFTRMDRGWRNMRDMLTTIDDWTARGVTVHFADSMIDTSSAMGSIFMRLLCMAAEIECIIKSSINKAVAARLRADSKPLNANTPFGFKKITDPTNGGWKVTLDAEKIRYCWWVNHMYRNHKMSMDKISDYLEYVLSKLENRRYIPRSGLGCPGVKKGVDKHITRRWGKRMVEHALINWERLHDLCRQAKAKKLTKHPLLAKQENG